MSPTKPDEPEEGDLKETYIKECCICFDNLEKIDVKARETLECGHTFCTICISTWIKEVYELNKTILKPKQPDCPSCRFPIESSISETSFSQQESSSNPDLFSGGLTIDEFYRNSRFMNDRVNTRRAHNPEYLAIRASLIVNLRNIINTFDPTDIRRDVAIDSSNRIMRRTDGWLGFSQHNDNNWTQNSDSIEEQGELSNQQPSYMEEVD